MPELAEVEKVRSLVEQHTLNKKIVRVTAFEDDIVFQKQKAKDIEAALANCTVHSVGRKGKIFWMQTTGTTHISFHLGMTGRMIVKGHDILTYYRYPDKNENANWPPRFVKLMLKFDDETQIAFTNTRRLGRVRLHRHVLPIDDEPINKLGYDPLNAMCDVHEFQQVIVKRKCPLKAALLDQSFTAGVGNWIADEVCYQAGVYPGVYCHHLTAKQVERVYSSLLCIVKFAVSVGADYSKFPQNWLFHYRWNKAIKKSPKHSKRKTKKTKQSKKKGKRKDSDKEEHDEQATEKYLNAHTDSFANEIVFEEIGGRTTAVVLALQSKQNGYRYFESSQEIGKIETYEEKLKRHNIQTDKYKLIEDVSPDTKGKPGTVSPKASRSKKRKLRDVENESDSDASSNVVDATDSGSNNEDPTPKRKKRKSADSVRVPLIPVECLRRSARLAARHKLVTQE